MTEAELQEIERRLAECGDADGWMWESTESMRIEPQDVTALIAEVRRLRDGGANDIYVLSPEKPEGVLVFDDCRFEPPFTPSAPKP